MRIVNIQFSQAIRLFPIAGLTGTLYGPNLSKAFEARFGFLQGPRTVAEYDVAKGISFLHGFYEGVVIDKFTIYGDGIVCETKANTDIADSFIQEATAWARKEAGFAVTDEMVAAGMHVYLSKLDVEADFQLDKALAKYSEVGKAIAALLRGYGRANTPDYGAASIQLHVDNTVHPEQKLPTFIFERIADRPYGERRYYSGAPLRTNDHLKILEQLSNVLMS